MCTRSRLHICNKGYKLRIVRGLASFNGKNKKVISMDETYLGMIFRPMGSCGKNFSSLGVVVTLSAEAYFFGGFT